MTHDHHHDSTRNIKTAFFLNVSFALLELFGGLLTNSLAILSDAIHDIGDSITLGVSWYLDKVSKTPRTKQFTYGLGRFSLLSALLSSIVLFIGSMYILAQAIPRLMTPEPTHTGGMMVFAILGIGINGLAILKLNKKQTMNERVIYWHLLEDVLGWIAVLIASICIYLFNLYILDPILSILIVIFVLWNVIKNLQKTASVFLQSKPDNVDISVIESGVLHIPKIKSIHDTHVWSLDGQSNVLTTHLVVPNNMTHDEMIAIKNKARILLKSMNITHSTIEIECENEKCEPDSY